MGLAEGDRHFLGGIIEERELAFVGKFEKRVGGKLGEGGELLEFGFTPESVHSHGEGGGDGPHEMDLVLGKGALPGSVDAEDAIGPGVALNGDGNAANDAVLGEELGDQKALFLAQIRYDPRFAGQQSVTGLGVLTGIDPYFANITVSPAGAGAQDEALTV